MSHLDSSFARTLNKINVELDSIRDSSREIFELNYSQKKILHQILGESIHFSNFEQINSLFKGLEESPLKRNESPGSRKINKIVRFISQKQKEWNGKGYSLLNVSKHFQLMIEIFQALNKNYFEVEKQMIFMASYQ